MTPAQTGSHEQVRIPLRDGGFLAASLYLPADGRPAPVLLEALPYRKDDLTAGYRPEYVRFRDEYGYAVARVDLRGTGSSTGLASDEYSDDEQADLVEAVGWLAAQEWSTGAVGMFGTSWSGFNALQIACRRPPALRAVVTSYASDDRWSDDVHWMGGALRLLDQVDYPLYMAAMNALPPVPDVFGDGWRDEWLRRVEGGEPWLLRWLAEQTDGPYWRRGSVRGPAGASYERIGCPVLVVAGWADGYRNNTFRTFRHLTAAGTPVHVLAGPWSHMAPATSVPGPGVDHVALMARWWDRWLRDVPNGVDADPPFSVFVRSYAVPEPDAATWPGRWEAHDAATLDAVRAVPVALADARLVGARPVAAQDVPAGAVGPVVRHDAVLDVGAAAWNSCAASLPWGQPLDQREDEARSLVAVLPVPDGTVVLGNPLVRLRIRPDAVRTHVSAKLSLAPAGGGPSTLVARGLLDLAHRDARYDAPAPPRALAPGEWVDVEVEVEATAFEMTAGHELRLVLACADWPNTVAPQGVWSLLDLGASSVVLPVSAGTPHPAPALPAPVPVPVAEEDDDEGSSHVQWQHGYDVLTRTRYADVDHGATYGGPHGVRCTEHYVGHVEVDARTGEQSASAMTRYELVWGDVAVRTVARLLLRVDADTVTADVDLEVDEGEVPLARRSWTQRVDRSLR